MEKPYLATVPPSLVTLEPGPFAWCACGKSSNQPFCDGTHNGTQFKPVLFKIAEKREAWLCNCKHTKNSPFCDETHKEHGEFVSIQT